jgi:hypothetical protein
MSEIKRDLRADLAICNAATPGPWIDNGNEIVTESNRFVGIAGALTDEDNQFIAEARTGWPHAIERALAAEAEVERLRRIFGHPLVYEALAHYTDEHIDSDTHPDDWETVFDARVAALKMAKEATE